MPNLFSTSNAKQKPVTIKETNPKINIQNLDFFEKVKELEIIQERMKHDKIKSDSLSNQVKEIGKSEWIKLYESNKENPGSIIVESSTNNESASIMIVPNDRYISIDKLKAEKLAEKFGEELISREITYTFDNRMVELYGEIISKLIEESDEIAEKDKDKIIKAVEGYSIKKGVIDILPEFGSVSEVMNEINPIMTMRNIEIVKS
jgi:hypothetical protein